jgi:ribose 5-phosphate isomerase B
MAFGAHVAPSAAALDARLVPVVQVAPAALFHHRLRRTLHMKIVIGNDQGGYRAKVGIVDHLRRGGHEVRDVGSHSEEIVRYPRLAQQVASSVAGGQYERGILICSTGIGMSIIANKFKGIRAALCTSTYMARMMRAHNDSNVLCLGGGITGPLELIDIVDTWLTVPFDGGRHVVSLSLIADAERALCTGQPWAPPAEDPPGGDR